MATERGNIGAMRSLSVVSGCVSLLIPICAIRLTEADVGYMRWRLLVDSRDTYDFSASASSNLCMRNKSSSELL
jgi:hypothetical protein